MVSWYHGLMDDHLLCCPLRMTWTIGIMPTLFFLYQKIGLGPYLADINTVTIPYMIHQLGNKLNLTIQQNLLV